MRRVGILVVVGEHVAYLVVRLGESGLVAEREISRAPRLGVGEFADDRILVVLGTHIVVDQHFINILSPLAVVVVLRVVVVSADNIHGQFLVVFHLLVEIEVE